MGHTILFALLMGVVLVLVAGVVLMSIGGDVNKKYGNKLMRARVLLQGSALLMLMVLFATGDK